MLSSVLDLPICIRCTAVCFVLGSVTVQAVVMHSPQREHFPLSTTADNHNSHFLGPHYAGAHAVKLADWMCARLCRDVSAACILNKRSTVNVKIKSEHQIKIVTKY